MKIFSIIVLVAITFSISATAQRYGIPLVSRVNIGSIGSYPSLVKRQDGCPGGFFPCSDGIGCCAVGTECIPGNKCGTSQPKKEPPPPPPQPKKEPPPPPLPQPKNEPSPSPADDSPLSPSAESIPSDTQDLPVPTAKAASAASGTSGASASASASSKPRPAPNSSVKESLNGASTLTSALDPISTIIYPFVLVCLVIM